MIYFPSNILLHESVYSGNYNNPDTHSTSTPAKYYTMNPPDPAASAHSHFLPSYFPSPAPQLVLSRPGTQQYSAQYSSDISSDVKYDARFSHSALPSHHQLQQYVYREPPYVPSIPLNIGIPGHRQSPLYQRPAVPPHESIGLPSLYGNPIYQRPAFPPHESIGLYGIYAQPEGHARLRHAQNTIQEGLPTAEPHSSGSSLSVASTPVLYRMSAKRLPGDKSYISAPQLESCLQKDLEGNVFTVFPNSFLDDLWPDSALPCPLNMDIFKHLTFNKIWDDKRECFITTPSLTENNMAEWLNTLGGMIGAFTTSNTAGFERKRSWSAGTHNKQPNGASINRKPDLVLVDRYFVDKQPNGAARPHISWTHIHAFAEVTRSYPLPKRIISTVNDKSYLLFICQQDRRFVPALSFNGQAQFALTLTDRQGQLSTPFVSFIHGKGNALLFMKILSFLMYGPLHNTGRDTTMDLDRDGRVKGISVNGHWYEVVYLIYSLQSMIGRGTTIWLVIRNNNYYILKDSWIQTSRVGSEINFLHMLKDDPTLQGHVPHIVEGEDVYIGGLVDSTGRYRKFIGGLQDIRTHRRLVMSPIGKQITTFQSMVEFIRAIIDIIGGK
jgi:hypothetical protein